MDPPVSNLSDHEVIQIDDTSEESKEETEEVSEEESKDESEDVLAFIRQVQSGELARNNNIKMKVRNG